MEFSALISTVLNEKLDWFPIHLVIVAGLLWHYKESYGPVNSSEEVRDWQVQRSLGVYKWHVADMW